MIVSYTIYLTYRLCHYQALDLRDVDLLQTFRYDFYNWTEDAFNKCIAGTLYQSRTLLQKRGVWMQKFPNPAHSLYNLLHEETWTEWSEQEIENPPITLEAATSLTTPQNSTIIPEGVTNLTTPNHSITTETENKEDGINSIITTKTDNITGPGGLVVAFPVSSTYSFPQSPDKVRSCSSGKHVPERLCDKDDCWSSHGKSPGTKQTEEKSLCVPRTLQSQTTINRLGPPGHPGQAELTCPLSQDPQLTDDEKEGQGMNKHGHNCRQGYRNSEGHNRNDKNSTTGIQNTIVILLSNCCTLCELCLPTTDPKKQLPGSDNTAPYLEGIATTKPYLKPGTPENYSNGKPAARQLLVTCDSDNPKHIELTHSLSYNLRTEWETR